MAVLENLKPEKVFKYFEELSSIPRGSGNTRKVSDWLVSFAKERNLEHYQDELNNVIIIKEATKNCENSDAIILQGHMDMVCEKSDDCNKDMENEGLDLVLDGDVISAKGTTLGADNGIAVAMMLAILDDDMISHPRVECVFTVDEETGMYGASFIDVSPLKGKMMLNVDSEDEGVFTVSCAGGNVTLCSLEVKREDFKGETLKIRINGLTGGHSGVEIDKGRANSNIIMGRLLALLAPLGEIRLISVGGGLKNNAIPVDTTAVLVTDNVDLVKAECEALEKKVKNEYRTTDKNMTVTVTNADYSMPLTKEDSDKVICMLNCLPDGVVSMSNDIKGLVQTSLNLGILKTEDNTVNAEMCVRSSVDSQKEMLTVRLGQIMKGLNGTAETFGDYAGWEYRKNSPLRDLMVNVFEKQYGHKPKIEAIHAGLECGVFSGKIKDLDCISFGPQLEDIHTFREKMYVSSVQRVWNMLLEVLKRLC